MFSLLFESLRECSHGKKRDSKESNSYDIVMTQGLGLLFGSKNLRSLSFLALCMLDDSSWKLPIIALHPCGTTEKEEVVQTSQNVQFING
jgi:hypothetical protein